MAGFIFVPVIKNKYKDSQVAKRRIRPETLVWVMAVIFLALAVFTWRHYAIRIGQIEQQKELHETGMH